MVSCYAFVGWLHWLCGLVRLCLGLVLGFGVGVCLIGLGLGGCWCLVFVF